MMLFLNHLSKNSLKNRLLPFLIKWQCLSIVAFSLFWLLWAVIDFPEYDSDGYTFYTILFDYIYCTSFTFCVVAICDSSIHLFPWAAKKRWGFICTSFTCMIINILLAILFESVVNQVYYPAQEDKVIGEGFYIYSTMATLLTIILLSGRHYELYIEELRKNRNIELMILKQQLNPHFMFNNLNTLDALIESDKETAHLYLNKLALFYRQITKTINIETIEICDAIDVIRTYNDLLQINIPGHIIIKIDDSLKHNHDLIVPMSLQLLVENAIKHNCHSQQNPIHIAFKKDGGYITVANTYNPIPQHLPTSKIGLDNLNKRCIHVTGKRCIINHTDTLFEVKIPIIQNPQK